MYRPPISEAELVDKGMTVYRDHMRMMASKFNYAFDFDQMQRFLDAFESGGSVVSALMWFYAKERVDRIRNVT